MKKIVIYVSAFVLCLLMFAGTVSAASVGEGYNAEYVLENKTTLIHYGQFNYTNGEDQVVSNAENKDAVNITFVDVDGNVLTKVPMWEYDQEDGKYYSLVWYIVEQELSYTWADQYVWANANGKWGNQYDTEGDQRKKYTDVVYTIDSVRAVDLTYEYGTTQKSYTYNNKNHANCSWTWARNGAEFKTLKTIYLDAEKTQKLQAPVGVGQGNKPNGYEGYEAQMEATGNRIIVANLKDLDFQTHYTDSSNKSLWTLATNLQCIWYPDTVVHVNSTIGANVREVVFEGLEVIGCQLFRENKYITEFRVPNKCEYICDETFRETNIKTLTYGESVKIVANAALSGTSPTTYYLSKNIVSSNYLTGYTNVTWGYGYIINSNKATIYLVGDLSDAELLWTKMSQDNTSYTEVHYYDYNKVKVREGSTGIAIFYNYNRCDAFYESTHAPSDEIHGGFLGQAFASEYKIYTECGRECGTENVIETIGQLIHLKGYSTSEIPGNKAMMHSFVVDKTLVSKYQEHFADLKFGVLAVGENTSSPFNGSLIDAQGNKAHEKIAMSEFTNRDFDEIEIKVGGIDGYEDRDLYFCGYVIGGESVYYIQNDTVATKATTITYTQVCTIVAEKEEE